MAVAVQLEADTRRVDAYLREIDRRGKRLEPALKRCAPVGHRTIQQNFEAGGRPDPWAPVKRVRVRRSRKGAAFDRVLGVSTGPDGVGLALPLQDTGRLKGSIEHEILEADVVWFTEVEYAKWQHFGSEGGQLIEPTSPRKFLRWASPDGWVFAKSVIRGTIPARPFMVLLPETAEACAEILADYVVMLDERGGRAA